MVGDLIDLEEENTMLREDLKDLREENKNLKDRIAKLAWLIQNKIEEEERTSVSFNEKEDIIEDQKSLEPLMSLEEMSVNPSSFTSTSIALKENEDLDDKSIVDIMDDIIEGKMIVQELDTEKDEEIFKRGMIKLTDAMARDIFPEPTAIEFDISEEEVETEPLSEDWGITGDTEVWTREDRI